MFQLNYWSTSLSISFTLSILHYFYSSFKVMPQNLKCALKILWLLSLFQLFSITPCSYLNHLTIKNQVNLHLVLLLFFLKMNKSVYIAKLRQRYHNIVKNILLQLSNHDLKDVYMLNYGPMKNTNSLYYTRFFIIINFLSYNLIKTDRLDFLHISLEYAVLYLDNMI